MRVAAWQGSLQALRHAVRALCRPGLLLCPPMSCSRRTLLRCTGRDPHAACMCSHTLCAAAQGRPCCAVLWALRYWCLARAMSSTRPLCCASTGLSVRASSVVSYGKEGHCHVCSALSSFAFQYSYVRMQMHVLGTASGPPICSQHVQSAQQTTPLDIRSCFSFV